MGPALGVLVWKGWTPGLGVLVYGSWSRGTGLKRLNLVCAGTCMDLIQTSHVKSSKLNIWAFYDCFGYSLITLYVCLNTALLGFKQIVYQARLSVFLTCCSTCRARDRTRVCWRTFHYTKDSPDISHWWHHVATLIKVSLSESQQKSVFVVKSEYSPDVSLQQGCCSLWLLYFLFPWAQQSVYRYCVVHGIYCIGLQCLPVFKEKCQPPCTVWYKENGLA